MPQLRAVVSGVVQGVGFRWWVSHRCDQLGLDGEGENLPDGTVVIAATGPTEAIERLLADVEQGRAGRPGVVESVHVESGDLPH